jgi:hypothetical protein
MKVAAVENPIHKLNVASDQPSRIINCWAISDDAGVIFS